ncbi:unnamed protein product [Ranitomeya imitator]|uniref:Neurexin/syndecan/glycophorin C domain-containing protein n=1 Tax=Ranitomeya imitator TaxID=111125 RepID=A0ABN9M3P0_9NEOB|nr:unnamed protein product [Ranitomeya imitator]
MVHRFTLAQASTDLNGQRHRLIQTSKHRKSHHDILKGFRETFSENSCERTFIPLSVVAATVVVVMILVIVLLRYLFRHKGTYTTNEDKDTEFAENANVALKSDTSLQETGDESKKEYFI